MHQSAVKASSKPVPIPHQSGSIVILESLVIIVNERFEEHESVAPGSLLNCTVIELADVKEGRLYSRQSVCVFDFH